MKKKKMYQEVINLSTNLQNSSQEFIYNSNIIALDLFYGTMLKKFGKSLSDEFLEMVSEVSNFNLSDIESCFSTIIIENQVIDDKFLDDYDGVSGLYFLYRGDNVVYVGMSSNLKKRALQSYLCKLPYGIDYVKIVPTQYKRELLAQLEACMIDYYFPLFNQKKEVETLSKRDYCILVNFIKHKLYASKPLYLFQNEESYEINVFDGIN